MGSIQQSSAIPHLSGQGGREEGKEGGKLELGSQVSGAGIVTLREELTGISGLH